MNKKLLGFALAFVFLAALSAPMVLATPGAEKNNEKFEYFELVCSGTDMGEGGKPWASPPDSDKVNVFHIRDAPWDDSSVDLVELTVGEETFAMTTDPYSLDYTTTYDIEVFYDNEGAVKKYNIRLTDVVTVYDEDVEIGTIVLNIVAVVNFAVDPPTYEGTVMGYGTGDLKSVHISAVDLGLTDPVLLRYTRIGTITGWPEDITNFP